ncbi:VanZ family protein [Riemerella anatipestifer]|uniref:VanZ family protein n=1 Tax=Riemerella anatipestifer TaxID=34085 RepID=UPI00129E42F3|nr:VanZ family protein [Riemerella anatipestifer]MRM83692.1 VanZ family protein [Riemerella anatipestifer]
MPIYWALLTYVLLKPVGEHKDYWFLFQGIDKVVHFSMFFVLGFLFRWAYPKASVYAYYFILVAYAILTEIFQQVMALGRSAEWLDLLADTIGLVLAYYVYTKVLLLFARK